MKDGTTNPSGSAFSMRLHAALDRAATELLAAQTSDGYWVGQLSSSALSTATAVTALAVVEREAGNTRFKSQITSGLDWLAQHANADGGWGDTILSVSNLSTTTLCWAAFGAVPGADEKYAVALVRSERWLAARVGVPHSAFRVPHSALSGALIGCYGKDRTFSAPILTMCALAGRLGAGREAWRHVIPLPFELAACPRCWFSVLRLSVVSYALPALIAIGQARHHHSPSGNPITRLLRKLTREHTLRVLTDIQPGNGGFLEATPLTSFVTMSLAGSGQASHQVTKRGVEFLRASQRTDGSWPIDTNLATWLTTLAVNALGHHSPLSTRHSPHLRSWLLDQQYRRTHPYTSAAPGGWAWTDLPGGVPDADDTAGALLALRQLGPLDDEVRTAATAGISWLLDLQNRDGGIPTFCRGWGALPFDRSSPDLTAHALRAWLAWRDEVRPKLQGRIDAALERGLAFLWCTQRMDGAWIPLWFGNQHAPADENPTYGTSRVVGALAKLGTQASPVARADFLFDQVSSALSKGGQWLLDAQNRDGAWGGVRDAPSSVEETALAIEALGSILACPRGASTLSHDAVLTAVSRGTNKLIDWVETGQWTQPAPIGLYFARLWYYERLYPLIFTVAALRRVAKYL